MLLNALKYELKHVNLRAMSQGIVHEKLNTVLTTEIVYKNLPGLAVDNWSFRQALRYKLISKVENFNT